MNDSVRLLRVACFCFLALTACADSAPPPSAPSSPQNPRACEDAYEDLTRYYDAEPERRRPSGLRGGPFLSACRELPASTQPCLLFSYMQAHTTACEKAIKASPDVMQRIAAMTGK